MELPNWMDSSLVCFVAGTLFGMTTAILVQPDPWLGVFLFIFGLGLAVALYAYFHQSNKLGFDKKKLTTIACGFCGAMHKQMICPQCKVKR